MPAKDDPRITNQASYLPRGGATLEWRSWSSDRPDRDHDHCEFCWVHLGDHAFTNDAGTQLEGWATTDGQHWGCRTCFADFREQFEFQTVNAAP